MDAEFKLDSLDSDTMSIAWSKYCIRVELDEDTYTGSHTVPM